MFILIFLVIFSSLVFAGREINCSLDDCTDLVGYWKLNEAGGTVNDSSDYGNNGTVTGATHGVKGKVGKALSFDGNGDYVAIPNAYQLNPEYNFTIGVWFNATGTDWYEGLVSKMNYTSGGGGVYYGYSMNMYQDENRFGVANYSSKSTPFTSDYRDNTWHFAVGVKNGTNLHIYIDGEKEQSATSAKLGNTAESLMIGRYYSNTVVATDYFTGMIDEVTVWNRSLNSSYIKGLYYLGVSPTNTSSDFSVSLGSTNFRTSSNIISVDNVKLANSHGSILWNGSLNAKDQNADKNVKIGSGYVSLNSSDLHSSWNSTANISISVSGCDSYTIYYADDIYTSLSDIKTNGQECDSSTVPYCKDIVCTGSKLNFTVSQFSSYGGEGSSSGGGAVPEWDDYAVLLILFVVIGGFFGIKKKSF